MQFCLATIIDGGKAEAFTNALIGILKGVLADQPDVYLLIGITPTVQEVVPRLHGRRLSNGYSYLAQDGCIKPLPLHVDWYFVDAGHVFALHHALQTDVAERSHLHA